MKITQTFIVAGTVLRDEDGKYLLVQEKQPHVYGLWNLPAGKVEDELSIEETAIKEAKEETGLIIRLQRKIAIFQENAHDPVQHAFLGKIDGGNIAFPQDEILNVCWFSLKDIEAMKDQLRGKWVLDSIYLVENKN